LSTFYLAQCISGKHVWEIIPGSELEKLSEQHLNHGDEDAIIIELDECPFCIGADQSPERPNALVCGELDCLFMPSSDDESDKCKDGCVFALSLREIKDSPNDQLLRIISRLPGNDGPNRGITFNGQPLSVP
jgi:hypothetical protein